MSKIIIVTESRELSNTALIELKNKAPHTIGYLRTAVRDRLPIIEAFLFYNDHQEISTKLKAIVQTLDMYKIPFSIYELGEENEYTASIDNEIDKIDTETLVNILDSHNPSE